MERLSLQLNYSIGTDIVYMPRFKDKLDNQQFLNKILTNQELIDYQNLKATSRKLEYLSGRFAVKEAYAKATKLGIGKLDFKDIEVLKDEHNAPYLKGINASISISHDNEYCIAVVMIGD